MVRIKGVFDIQAKLKLDRWFSKKARYFIKTQRVNAFHLSKYVPLIHGVGQSILKTSLYYIYRQEVCSLIICYQRFKVGGCSPLFGLIMYLNTDILSRDLSSNALWDLEMVASSSEQCYCRNLARIQVCRNLRLFIQKLESPSLASEQSWLAINQESRILPQQNARGRDVFYRQGGCEMPLPGCKESKLLLRWRNTNNHVTSSLKITAWLWT